MDILKSAITKNGHKIELLGNSAEEDKILVIGVFHGDEPQGKFLIESYIEKNPNTPLLFIPCLNPDGMELKTRTNANGVDLNRNFPTENWEWTEKNEFFGGETPGSEIETKFITEAIEDYKPSMILTLHAPFCVVNFDGDAKEIAQHISKIINYPVQENIGYPTPGSFGTFAGIENSIPTITLELDEKTEVTNLATPVHKIFDYLSDF